MSTTKQQKAPKINGKSKSYRRASERASNTGVDRRRERMLKRYRGVTKDVAKLDKHALPGGVSKIKKSADASIEEEVVRVEGNNKKDWFVVDTLGDSYSVVTDDKQNLVQLVHDESKEDFITRYASLLTQQENPPEEKTYTMEEMKEIFEQRGIPVSDDFGPLYDEATLWRFHDGMRVDGATINAFMRTAMFVVGTEYPKIMFDANRSYPDKESERLAIARMSNNFVYWSIQNEIERYDRICSLWENMFGSFLQMRQYGRFCIQIQWDPDTKMPVALKLLNAMRLGRPFVDIRYWNVVGVEYFDFRKPQNIIFSENMVYGVNRDYHQSPGSYRTGYSDLEPIMHLIELNIIINSMDLKEINKRFWIPYILVKVNSENRLAVNALKMAFKTGTGIFSTIDYSVQPIEIKHNGDFIITEREKNDEKIAQDTGLPVELAGKAGEVAQGQTSQVLQGFNQTTVAYYQLLLRNIWEKWYYGPLLMRIIKRRKELQDSGIKDNIIEEEREIWKEYQKKKEDDRRKMVEELVDKVNRRSTFTGEPSPEQATTQSVEVESNDALVDQILDETEDPAMDVPSEEETINKLSEYEKYEELPCKIKIMFTKKSFDTQLEQGTFYSGLLKDEIVTKEFIQEKLGFEELILQGKAQQQIDITMSKILADVMSRVEPTSTNGGEEEIPPNGQESGNNQPPGQNGGPNSQQGNQQQEGLGNKMGNAFNRQREGSDRKRGPNIPTTGAR